jgi:DNA-binding NtrC family response regulator
MDEICGKVLLVDAERTLTMALSDALVDADISSLPLVAGTAEEALAHLRDDPNITLILLDLGLPGVDGNALAERILTEFPQTRVILTTTNACAPMRANFEARILGILERPFDLEEFLALADKGLRTL